MIYVVIVIAAFGVLIYFGRRGAIGAEKERRNRPLLDPAEFRAELQLLMPGINEMVELLALPGRRRQPKYSLPDGHIWRSGILESIDRHMKFEYWEDDSNWTLNPFAVAELLKYELTEAELAVVYYKLDGADFTNCDIKEKVKELVDRLPSRE
jgi:hypothetical protein